MRVYTRRALISPTMRPPTPQPAPPKPRMGIVSADQRYVHARFAKSWAVVGGKVQTAAAGIAVSAPLDDVQWQDTPWSGPAAFVACWATKDIAPAAVAGALERAKKCAFTVGGVEVRRCCPAVLPGDNKRFCMWRIGPGGKKPLLRSAVPNAAVRATVFCQGVQVSTIQSQRRLVVALERVDGGWTLWDPAAAHWDGGERQWSDPVHGFIQSTEATIDTARGVAAPSGPPRLGAKQICFEDVTAEIVDEAFARTAHAGVVVAVGKCALK